jgi:uncharacterized protein (TIGR00288 family)
MNQVPNIAVFADYENVAIGAKDAGYGKLDVDLVLARLLEKGKVLVKKAYADWSRYEPAKKAMHEAAFELVEVPHTSYSGKNSADIRLVVDALDLCYTKPHIQYFAIVSGDSDFSPLVNKLRENDKEVIGVGVKNSSSDLLVENCDEFIYYDDLVRRKAGEGKGGKGGGTSKGPKDGVPVEERHEQALEMVLDAAEALFNEGAEKFWGSQVKQLLRRKHPHFAESYYGYRSFNRLLEDAKARGYLEMERDKRSGGYVITDYGPNVDVE